MNRVATRGTYGIIHNDNALVTYQFFDMHPSGHGLDLASEAWRHRDRALEVGERSTKVAYCEYSTWEAIDWGELLERAYSPDELSRLSGSKMRIDWEAALTPQLSSEERRELMDREAYHYILHRPKGPLTEHSGMLPETILQGALDTFPSFLWMAGMEEVYEGEPAEDQAFHYTWVTSPQNLFVASSEWPIPRRWEAGSKTAVWDLTDEADLADLFAIMQAGYEEFEVEVRQRTDSAR